MSEHLRWRVFCEAEGCDWIRHRCESRQQAARLGRSHAKSCRHVADEWRFRVQGIRVQDRPAAGRVKIGNKSFPPHQWEPSPTSRNASLPCGVCRIYRYVHDDMYGVRTLRADANRTREHSGRHNTTPGPPG